MLKIINSLISDWKQVAENHRKAGGTENFWKADVYAYCVHRLQSAVLTSAMHSDGEERCISSGMCKMETGNDCKTRECYVARRQ